MVVAITAFWTFYIVTEFRLLGNAFITFGRSFSFNYKEELFVQTYFEVASTVIAVRFYTQAHRMPIMWRQPEVLALTYWPKSVPLFGDGKRDKHMALAGACENNLVHRASAE